MLLLLCLLLLGKIESQVFLDALDGGVQVDLVAVVVKRSLMRYIINRGRADGRRAQLFDQGIPIAGQRVGGVGLLPVRDGLRQIGVFHIPLYREALVEGIQLHNGVCQHDLDKSFCQCGVGGVSRDGNDLFGLKAAAGQRPDGNGGVAPKQLQRVGTAAYNAGTAGVTPLGHLDQAHGKLRLGHALSVAAGHHILVGLGGDLLATDHLSGGLQECAQRVLVNALLLREEPGAGGNIEGIKNILVGGVKNQALLLMLPGAIFGTLTQPSTAINNDLEVAANVIQLRNSISNILQEAYEDTLAEIESERANLTYSDVVDSVGGHVSYNAFQLISMYCAYQGEDDYTKISLTDLSEQVQAHRAEYYAYTTSEEVRTEPVQKEVRGQTITVQEDHTYTVFALSYVGDDYFADTVWQLDDKQKSYADAYTHNLTVYLHEIEEREGISILGQINDALIDDDSPAPGGGFGNPFNDPNWEQHITSFFGKREDVGIPGKDTTNHNGLDIAYPYGTPILAVGAGTVIKAGYHVSYGNYLVINHGGGYCTLYAHCSQLLAQVGDTVNKYDTIAKVGATGDVTGNHLHICVIVNGIYVNPKGYLH